MLELKHVENPNFDNVYVGTAISGWQVRCILDDDCVRYAVVDNIGKQKKRREYRNDQKERCLAMAIKELNRI